MAAISRKNLSLGLASQDLNLGDQLRAQTDAILANRATQSPADNLSDAGSTPLLQTFGGAAAFGMGQAAYDLLTPRKIMR